MSVVLPEFGIPTRHTVRGLASGSAGSTASTDVFIGLVSFRCRTL